MKQLSKNEKQLQIEEMLNVILHVSEDLMYSQIITLLREVAFLLFSRMFIDFSSNPRNLTHLTFKLQITFSKTRASTTES